MGRLKVEQWQSVNKIIHPSPFPGTSAMVRREPTEILGVPCSLR